MTIKHLVISGGGPLGLRYMGALQTLHQKEFWKTENIQSIYATSIGTLLGTFICLKYDWETLNKYIIERPWHDAFKVTGKQIFDSYYNKGLFDKKLAEIILTPLLKAKDLPLNITLKEFYNYSEIDFHLFTFDLNSFQTVELSHTSQPNLMLVDALTMSSALPGIFMPIITENSCYIDGGVMCNYPINECLRDHPDETEILGIQSSYNKEHDGLRNATVNRESSLLDYVVSLTINSMNFITQSVKKTPIKNVVKCYLDENPLTLDNIKEAISSQDMRREWIKQGEQDANIFLQQK
jgi:predicted acylesterase/phospholipase RssA